MFVIINNGHDGTLPSQDQIWTYHSQEENKNTFDKKTDNFILWEYV